jgi:Leucine-rich repeat (LRR) protein
VSGRVDLEGERLDDLSRLGQPKMMRQLNVSFCQITSIAGLRPLPKLEAFIADGSQISTLTNFSAISAIRLLSLRNTPVAADSCFILSAAVICPRLASLNGRQVPPLVRQRAALYPDVGRRLIDAGWLATFPCPSEDALSDLCVQFQVPDPALEATEEADREAAAAEDVDRFEDIMQDIWEQHRKLICTIKARCGLEVDGIVEEQLEEEDSKEQQDVFSGTEILPEEDEPEEQPHTLLQRLAELLRRNDVKLDEENLYASVIRAVDGLCSEATEQKMSRLRREAEEDQEEDADWNE